MNQFHHHDIDRAFSSLAVTRHGCELVVTIGNRQRVYGFATSIEAKLSRAALLERTFVSFTGAEETSRAW